MMNTSKKAMLLSLAIIAGCYAQSGQAQETLSGLTVLNPRTNMYLPYAQREKNFVAVRNNRSVHVPRAQVAPAPQGEVDTQSYRVSPVPSFLIEEAIQDRAQRGVQETTAGPGMAQALAQLNGVDGEVKDIEKSEKKKVEDYVRRPKLWYGGPWRKG